MSGLERLATALSHPVEVPLRLAARAAPGMFWRRYRSLCEATRLDGPRFLLSFDCDTDRDFAVVEDVHRRVTSAGAKPCYAVPGALLEKGAGAYVGVRDAGGEFMNHGYAEHSAWEPGTSSYRSTLEYRELSRPEVAADIAAGHRAVLDVLGVTCTGFRTPHFGSFQRVGELHFLHGVLAGLGYRWSSSTMPLQAFRHGPAVARFGLVELPVSGCAGRPLSVLDSYSFRYTPGGARSMADFEAEGAALAQELEQGRPFVVNLYADPSQVHDWPGFFDAVARMAPWSIGFAALVTELGPPAVA